MKERVFKCVREALPRSGKLSLWLLKIILPVSLLVRLLQYYGIIDYLAEYLHPLFNLVGLPGATAIVFITSIFLPLYAAIAVMTSLAMTMREATILAVMCLIAHNLIVECAVTKKTGSSFWGMVVLRISMAFVAALFLNNVLPVNDTPFMQTAQVEQFNSLGAVLVAWLYSSLTLIITILVIVTALMILQRLLSEFRLIDAISRPLRPLMRVFGLPDSSPFLWIVGNVIGLAYGGAIMADMVEEGNLTLKDANTVNHHLAISHSLLEDTLLFVALGINFWIIVGTRILFAMLVVWVRRFIIYIGRQKNEKNYSATHL
ncbi:nucleoside recognition domain-containing protein [Bacteroides sp. 51]|uniref:nucleoside recognition domain-containing protein n=1 Tax=Bacteroides sp. 51 TaxID=2302938 RepID=UPI0013D72CF1|nr:nucleoside recognition domain-containing protein [Bacteroides sp. 51]NDV83516.1 nucleoside recognition protein [Bacteroides sp. 51]